MSGKHHGFVWVTLQRLEELLAFDQETQIIDVIYNDMGRKTNGLLLKLSSPTKCKIIIREGNEIPIYPLKDIQNGKAKTK